MKRRKVLPILIIISLIPVAFFPIIHSYIVDVSPSVFTITSPSMVPTLNIGDIVFIKKLNPSEACASPECGDIVAIKGPQYYFEQNYSKDFLNLANNTPIIHRIVEKEWNPSDKQWYFVTKGDANQFVDGGFYYLNSTNRQDSCIIGYNSTNAIKIPESQILGKVYLIIPYIGFFEIYSIQIFSILGGIFIVFLILSWRKIEITVNIRRKDKSGENNNPEHPKIGKIS